MRKAIEAHTNYTKEVCQLHKKVYFFVVPSQFKSTVKRRKWKNVKII